MEILKKMTKNEFINLDGSTVYCFKFYNGITRYGFSFTDTIERKYYIVGPREDNSRPIKEIGILVQPEQISRYEPASKIPPSNHRTFTIEDNPNSKKAIILGAGASYDFTYEANVAENSRMPLTKDLFSHSYNDILKNYEGAFDLASEINLISDLEHYFQKQWAKIERTHDLQLLKKLINTQYYLHDLFFTLSERFSMSNRSNYVNLVKLAHEFTLQHDNEIIPIITFNYDTLVEEAIKRVTNDDFNELGHYIDIKKRKIALFKPHGSCNWVKDLKPGLVDTTSTRKNPSRHFLATEIYRNNYNISQLNDNLTEQIRILHKTDSSDVAHAQYYPSILIPYKDKDDLIMPENHKTLLSYFLPKIEDILIIGWKGAEANFQDILKNRIGDKPITITLVEPNLDAIHSFVETYSNVLPKATIITKPIDGNDGATFSQYMKFCLNSDNHFFT